MLGRLPRATAHVFASPKHLLSHTPRTCASESRALSSHAFRRRGLQPSPATLPTQCRCKSSDAGIPIAEALSARSLAKGPGKAEEANPGREEVPSYQMTFTCRRCLDRSSHRISKQAYHHGTTLITCPGCKNRHLISDHLKIFSDSSITLEDILREKGQFLRKGSLRESDGGVEFWDDSPKSEEESNTEAEKPWGVVDYAVPKPKKPDGKS